ncbi:DUF2628 domain-containing protein [Paenibacillus chibensis]|uniref:DUF2628 domain-containing protein n=1 Tax=Paenibacillus chibensis TaxID=59846 RepID=UPI0013E3877F|nr:DUF2628 domain-containing protein [Paenibacillus chibensis]MEC0370034.1 DUF2628 domain-containing protein [Paenibacillus chibensis]
MIEPAYQTQSVSKEKLFDFAGNGYYDEAWEKPIRWNFGAFLFSYIWLAYRKMYFFAALYVVIGGLIIELLGGLMSATYSYCLGLGISFIFGFMANKIYYYHAERVVAKVTSMYADPVLQKERIVRSGGTNLGAAYVAGAIAIIALITTYGNF